MADEVIEQPATVKPAKKSKELVDTKKDWGGSDALYHNAETAKIAEDRAKDISADKPYEYAANGYTVTEVSIQDREDGSGPVLFYKVNAEGFEQVFTSKSDAELFVRTHTLAHKDLPAGTL